MPTRSSHPGSPGDPGDFDPPPSQVAQFLFDPQSIADSQEPTEDNARLIWLFLTLIRRREIDYRSYASVFVRSDRTFKRDLAKLRELGAKFGFALSRMVRKTVHLKKVDGEPIDRTKEGAADVLRALADAFGEVVTANLRGIVDIDGTAVDRFLRVATPQLVAQSEVAARYATVRAAWSNRARIRFRYPERGSSRTLERTVEPYAATYYAGRYYLVGYDVRPRAGGWRQFALDRIVGPIGRTGTFERRTIPPHYRGEDAIGLFKTGAKTEVTIALSADIAAAVLARRWQGAQRVVMGADRAATMTLEVYDLGEAVRWAMGFGDRARVVAPPAAVALARELAERVARSYAAPSNELESVS